MIKSNTLCLSAESSQPLAKINKVYFNALRLYERNDWKAAKTAFQDFLSLSDQNLLYIPSMYYLATCYFKLHEGQKSAALYQKVISQASPEEVFWSQMAQKRLEEISLKINNLN